MNRKILKIYNNSKKININDNSKIVIMSDCHRGNGNNYDSSLKNKNIVYAALNYYYKNDFMYIELGDGDELWEVKKYDEIIEENIKIFKLLKKFYDKKRLIMIYGNHDICKKNMNNINYYNKITKQEEVLIPNIKFLESLILLYKDNNIFLIHGHQLDFNNNYLLNIPKFFIRNLWKKIENMGVNDPTKSAKNYKISKKLEKKYEKISKKEKIIVVTGHTHRPIFSKAGESFYFNDGSCIHPNGITCLEIKEGYISLVKWHYSVKDTYIIVEKQLILKERIISYFK